MVKLKARGRALSIGGSIITASDSGRTVNDIVAGDLIGVCRKRGAGAWTILNRKDGAQMSLTIPAGASAIIDAIGVEVSLHILIRALDDAGLTNAQKAAIFDRLNDATNAGFIQVDDNPWA